ncbi:LysR family transcriptional regulator [Devosia faecipullorum]|uniref:LysR family transcriptional regulator n=1 Tax=Devosia faecipullorum TaxID=2755039 RepID=UPI00187B8FCC|nr:LysR family transcriptional regulator [Devosia faecipullorum]MBE7733354.1 LysR family transcriptional regulator [Devosia faecipullorum]
MDKLLNQFLAVADAGSLSGAATNLFITQPTLTFNMRKLEEQIGTPLFERSSRGVRLTRYGDTLYENAQLMRRLYDNTLDAIADQQRGTERGLSIGSGYSWWTMFLKDMIITYQREFPKSPVQVSLGNQLRLMDQLLSGDISMFLAHEIDGLSSAIGTDFVPLTRVYNAFFVRAGHPLLGDGRSQSDVDAYPVVISSLAESRHERFFDPSRRRTRVETVFDHATYAFRSNSLAACIDYTLSTEAVLLHTHMMRDDFRERGLFEVEQSGEPRRAVTGIYVLKERRGDERIEDMILRITKAAHAVLPPLA